MNDLISRHAALAACQKVADEAKAYGIPQMTMGAHTCRDAIRELPASADLAATLAANAALVVRLDEALNWYAEDTSSQGDVARAARAFLAGGAA